jgi:ribosomal protein L29
MKLKDKKELQAKDATELKKLLKDAKTAMMTLLLDKEQNKLKNTSSLSNKRREIAVIQTILREKEETNG